MTEKEKVDRKAKLTHLKPEWTQHHAARSTKADKAVEEAQKRLRPAQKNLDAKLKDAQEQYEEQQQCTAKHAAVKAHFSQGDDAAPAFFFCSTTGRVCTGYTAADTVDRSGTDPVPESQCPGIRRGWDESRASNVSRECVYEAAYRQSAAEASPNHSSRRGSRGQAGAGA